MKKPRAAEPLASRASCDPYVLKKGLQLRALEEAVVSGNMHDVAAAVAALLGYRLSVSRVRRQLARVARVPGRDIALRQFCRVVAENTDELEAAIQKLMDMPASTSRRVENKKNRPPKTGTNRNPGGVKIPARGKSKISPKQRARIAAGRIAGKPAAKIAAEAGLSESAVKKNVNDYRTVTIIQGWKNRQRRQIDQALDLTLRSLLRDLRSRDNDLVRDARRDVMRISTLGDPRLYPVGDAGGDAGDGVTYEELISEIRRMRLRATEAS